MDPDKDIAEERLLRVIEKSQSRPASASGHRLNLNPIHGLRMWMARRYAKPIGKNSARKKYTKMPKSNTKNI